VTALAGQLPALQVVVPLLTAPLVLLLPGRGLPWAAATAASLMAFSVAVAMSAAVLDGHVYRYHLGGWPPPYGIELVVDAFSAVVLLVVTGASTVALASGRLSLNREVGSQLHSAFYTAWLMALAGLTGILVSGDAFNIFVFLEISSLASYVLVAAGPDRRALTAAFRYLMLGTIGATLYLIGVGLVYLMTGTLNLADMELRIHDVADQRPILVAAGFITLGLALKAAVFPLHVWLPNAYTFAPNAVTVFVAACGTKVALYVLLRFDFFVFQGNLAGHAEQFAWFFMPLALLATLVGSGAALRETNLKRLLAFSSVAQVGYIVLGASLVSLPGLTAGVVHMFNHALAKGTLFLAAAAFALRFRTLELERLAGAGRHMPFTSAALVLAGFSLVGIPGTAGFVTKWYLVTAALSRGGLGILVTALVLASSLLAAAYVWRIVRVVYFGTPGNGMSAAGRADPLLVVAACATGVAGIWFGLVPDAPLRLSQAAARALLGHLP
jgi:multicomponent Na+:H+ antiporter subunit D